MSGGGLKYDTDKIPWDLLPIPATEGMLRVLQYGRRKYTRCAECGKKTYENPRLDGDPEVEDCPHCGCPNLMDGAWNWALGFKWTRLVAAAFRHLAAIARGKDIDDGPDGSGLPHVDHLQCCAAFLSAHFHCRLGTDDRYKWLAA